MTKILIERSTVEQALEALEWHYRQGHSNTLGGLRLKIDEKALRNLKAALAEPVQKPVVDAAIHAAWTAGFVEGEKAALAEPVEPVQEPYASYASMTTRYTSVSAEPEGRCENCGMKYCECGERK